MPKWHLFYYNNEFLIVNCYIVYSNIVVSPATVSMFSIGEIDFKISGFVINTGVINGSPFDFMNSLSILIIGSPALTLVPCSANCSNPSPFIETV